MSSPLLFKHPCLYLNIFSSCHLLTQQKLDPLPLQLLKHYSLVCSFLTNLKLLSKVLEDFHIPLSKNLKKKKSECVFTFPSSYPHTWELPRATPLHYPAAPIGFFSPFEVFFFPPPCLRAHPTLRY